MPKKTAVIERPSPAIPESILMAKATIGRQIIPKINLKGLINSATRNIGGRYGLFIEAITNSNDYRAENIYITLEGKGSDCKITILDDGLGMGPDGRDSFMSVAVSHSILDETKSGRHGLGTKRMMAEFQFCEVVDISAEEKDGKMRVMCFSWDDWLKKLDDWLNKKLRGDTSAEFPKFPEGEIKRDPRAIGLAPDKTGVKITLWNPRGERNYTLQQLIDNLASGLAPWVAKKIRISTDGREWKPLRMRELVGNEIEFHEDHPILGRVYVRIYLPKTRAENDRFMIGAMGPICSFSEFRTQLPDYLYKQLPRVLFNPSVCGMICVNKFNQYRDVSSESFDASLYGSELMTHFIRYLIEYIEDPVEERFGEVRTEKEDIEQKRLLEEVASLCNVLGGEKPIGGSKKNPPKNIILSVKNVELLTGEKITISVRRYPESTRQFQWIAKDSGGLINASEGKEIIYTAGKNIGEFVLHCQDKDNPEISSSVNISIVPKKQLRISPSQATLEFGESIILKAVNVADDSSGAENIIWSTDEPEGQFRPNRGEHVNYTTGSTPGTYEIVCTDRKNRKKFARCYINVVQEKPERTHIDHGEPGTEIEGIRYRLFQAKATNAPDISWKVGTERNRYIDIYVNFQHPVMVQARAEGKFSERQVAIRQVLMHHIEATHENEPMTIPNVNEIMARLNAKIVEEIIQREEG